MSYTGRLVVIALTINLVVGALAFLWLDRSRAQHEESALAATQNLSELLLHDIGSSYESTDKVLLAVADAFAHQAQSGAIDAGLMESMLQRQLQRHPGLVAVRITDADGNIRFGSAAPLPPQSGAADRDYFLRLRADPAAGLVVSGPVVGRISGKPGMILARRLNHADGSFAGIVLANLGLDPIAARFASLKLGHAGSIAMRDAELGMIVRQPAIPQLAASVSRRISDDFRAALARDAASGSYVSGATSIDGVVRVHSYRRHPRYPFYINVGMARDELFAAWRSEVGVSLLILLIFAATTGAGVRSLDRSWQRREQAIRNLAASEARWHLLVDSSPVPMLVSDADGGVGMVNAAFTQLLGFRLEDMPRLDAWWQQAVPDDARRQRLLAEWTRRRDDGAAGGPGAAPLEVELVDTRGGRHVVLLSTVALDAPDAGGHLMVLYDITERIEARRGEALAQRALRLLGDCNNAVARAEDEASLLQDVCRLMVGSGGYRMAWIGRAENDAAQSVVPVAIAGAVDGYLDHVRISWSAASEAGQGPTGASIRLQTAQVNQDFAANPSVAPWREEALRRGYRASIALPLLTRHTGCYGALMIYAGEPDAFAPDETELLRELAGNLAFGIEKLRDRERRVVAEAANVAKSAFLANMSHEIRTPLNAISGMAYLVRRGGVTARQAEQLDHIDAAGRHLLEIINDILDLSKIEAGKLVIEESELAIEAIVGNVVSMLRDKVVAKGLTLTTEVDALPQPLCGDPTRLQQALLNYVGNAVKFTEAGSIAVRVACVEEDESGVLLRFEVEDQGIGIAADALGRLFHRFEQADSSTTRRYGGTGLGLVITGRLAQLMGGDAGVDSAPGVGSRFWFTARLKKGSGRSEPARGGSIAAELRLAREFAGRRVLVVEDEPVNQEIARILLEQAGLMVELADDGKQAVAMVAANHYDLIVMDMQMPELDGIEATRRIRALPEGGVVPIVAMTANAFAEDRARCLEAGMDDFISKPVDPVGLHEAVLRWLARGDRTRPA